MVDADLSGYFDTIPHHELMKCVARRVSDGAMLALVKAWLEMAVEEDDGRGNRRRTTVNKDSGRGSPQGAPISPLLANLYMRRFLLGWKQQGWERKLKAKIVSYADDVRHFTRASDPFRRRERSGEDDLWVNGLPESENRREQEHAANAGVVRSR